ncbi:MAG: FAD-linked oxidase C-terminal domain-containing protein [Candidatus Firestonebacteria bacterium]
MDEKVLTKIRKIFDRDRLKTSREELIAYSYDGFIKECLPEAVVFPESTEEVSELVKLANEEKFHLTSRGSGSNLCGAAIPQKGGVVVCFSKMDKTIKINKDNRYAVVQAGKILENLQRELEDYDLFYPIDLGSARIATIGGSVALNSGGMRSLKYGVTRDYLIGLKVVLPSGDIIKTGVLTRKNVVGYDLNSLFCGSEGTLGIVTEVTVKLIVKPKFIKVLLNHYQNIDNACDAINEIMASGVIPTALELVDNLVINAVEDYVKIGLKKDAAAFLLIELTGDKDQVERDSIVVEALCKKNNPSRSEISKSAEESEKLWLARKSGFGSMARFKPICITEDVTVPVAFLSETIKLIHELSKKHGVLQGLLSHAGDGNLHPHFLLDNKNEEHRVDDIMDELMPFVISVGGTISGEHGVGIGKKKFLHYQLDDKQLGLMRKIKKLFDPSGILNPGSFLD